QWVMTGSPGDHALTRSPTALTTPDASTPSAIGGGGPRAPPPPPPNPPPARPDHAGRFDAERHRRAGPDVPSARPHELLPVGDARRADIDEDLVGPERSRLRQGDRMHGTAELVDPRCY